MERKASVKKESKVLMTATVMGIHTKEFGENTHLSDALLAQPYYEYLNELAVEPEGVLLSSNCKNVLECKVGDTIFYSNKDGSEAERKSTWICRLLARLSSRQTFLSMRRGRL